MAAPAMQPTLHTGLPAAALVSTLLSTVVLEGLSESVGVLVVWSVVLGLEGGVVGAAVIAVWKRVVVMSYLHSYLEFFFVWT